MLLKETIFQDLHIHRPAALVAKHRMDFLVSAVIIPIVRSSETALIDIPVDIYRFTASVSRRNMDHKNHVSANFKRPDIAFLVQKVHADLPRVIGLIPEVFPDPADIFHSGGEPGPVFAFPDTADNYSSVGVRHG